jgi:hypothetical protein
MSDLQYNSYSDIDVIRNLINKSEEKQVNSNYLGNAKESKIIRPTVNMANIVPANITDDNGEYGQIVAIDEPVQEIKKPKEKKIDEKNIEKKNREPTDIKEFDVFLNVLTDDYIGKFYFASITIIGLYIVFRMIKK